MQTNCTRCGGPLDTAGRCPCLNNGIVMGLSYKGRARPEPFHDEDATRIAQLESALAFERQNSQRLEAENEKLRGELTRAEDRAHDLNGEVQRLIGSGQRLKLKLELERSNGEQSDVAKDRRIMALERTLRIQRPATWDHIVQLRSDLARERERAEACALELCRVNDILGDSEWPELRRSLDATQAALERAEDRLREALQDAEEVIGHINAGPLSSVWAAVARLRDAAAQQEHTNHSQENDPC